MAEPWARAITQSFTALKMACSRSRAFKACSCIKQARGTLTTGRWILVRLKNGQEWFDLVNKLHIAEQATANLHLRAYYYRVPKRLDKVQCTCLIGDCKHCCLTENTDVILQSQMTLAVLTLVFSLYIIIKSQVASASSFGRNPPPIYW